MILISREQGDDTDVLFRDVRCAQNYWTIDIYFHHHNLCMAAYISLSVCLSFQVKQFSGSGVYTFTVSLGILWLAASFNTQSSSEKTPTTWCFTLTLSQIHWIIIIKKNLPQNVLSMKNYTCNNSGTDLVEQTFLLPYLNPINKKTKEKLMTFSLG